MPNWQIPISLRWFGKLYIDQLSGISNEEIINNHMLLLKKEENLTAADIMNCPNNENLKSYPAWVSVFPWDRQSIKYKYDNYIESFIKNRSKHGAKISFKNANLKKEVLYSTEIAISHLKQNEKLIKSFRDKGIQKTDKLEFPRIIILMNDLKEWRWIIKAGTHRSYIFYFFGLKKFSAIIDDVVYRKSLASCYNVKNGLYSLEEATNIFDGIFDGSSYVGGIV